MLIFVHIVNIMLVINFFCFIIIVIIIIMQRRFISRHNIDIGA